MSQSLRAWWDGFSLIKQLSNIVPGSRTLKSSIIENDAVLLFDLRLELHPSKAVEIQIRGLFAACQAVASGNASGYFATQDLPSRRAWQVWFRPLNPAVKPLKICEFTIRFLEDRVSIDLGLQSSIC